MKQKSLRWEKVLPSNVVFSFYWPLLASKFPCRLVQQFFVNCGRITPVVILCNVAACSDWLSIVLSTIYSPLVGTDFWYQTPAKLWLKTKQPVLAQQSITNVGRKRLRLPVLADRGRPKTKLYQRSTIKMRGRGTSPGRCWTSATFGVPVDFRRRRSRRRTRIRPFLARSDLPEWRHRRSRCRRRRPWETASNAPTS